MDWEGLPDPCTWIWQPCRLVPEMSVRKIKNDRV
jgi:hypothetical protein